MADQTGAAVDSLLGLLSGAIKDEARLLGGVQGDMQFIKDEMDSMNGFLLHLNRMESEHDDQLRAWMKQVRDIAYIAQDCIELYMGDIAPLQEPSICSWAFLRRLPKVIRTIPSRHRLATKIQELKVRVRDVGERRQRYDVTIRSTAPRQQKRPAGQGGDKEAKREEFLDALLGPHRCTGDGSQDIVDIDKAIGMLPARQLKLPAAAGTIRAIVEGCSGRTAKAMFLCALYTYPHGTPKELNHLEKKKTDEEEDLDEAVMIFCYSKLSTHYKSCLQYLTAFQKEDTISRTIMVRRWLAEGLVAREEEGSLEDAAENCFGDLVFRGFICPDQIGAAGRVKSCQMDEAMKKFVINISKSENFVGGDLLPDHLKNQVTVREIVRKQQQQQQPPPAFDSGRASMITACCNPVATAAQDLQKRKDPLVDEIVKFLKDLRLKNPLYRLNVLDLGGCKGLRTRHLKAICKVRSLKYLSLQDTDIDSVLPSEINNLKKLETLDIRKTDVQAMDNIFLPNLKHLLAGRSNGVTPTADESPVKSSLTTVRMPCKIAKMRYMEILSHVQVTDGDTGQLDLPAEANVRKLGVLLMGSKPTTISHLLRTVSKLSGSLRSLSIWIRPPDHNPLASSLNMEITQPPPNLLESLHINGVLGNNGLPTWCRNLNMLSKVTLCGTNLPLQSLSILGKLQKLCCLRLRYNSFNDTKLIFNDAGGFCNLKFLLMEDTMITNMTVEPSSVPKLERITWWCSTNTSTDVTSLSTFLNGIEDLPSLKFVELNPGHHIHSFQIKKIEVTAGMMLENVQ